ncbi:adenosine deaminase [Streptomonospora litoralis]|uniref:Aminodeoxyfutalosine deaminase n=1 Tax=Streptomonospora litoralis TaxID=2498135 RepID=A0A4V0ZK73_9ACTN|nr:adenosine deaminase [Streptomonospora litoralis]QBI55982.1 Aminodeoxyfutalosine deaminase [Streptomonospora litoralis]
MARPISRLPKAHLHQHFTGSMRHATLVDLAQRYGVHLPHALATDWPPRLRATDERGWFRFQRLYDIARSVLRTPEAMYRLLSEAAEEERSAGSGWLEIQVDPSGYAARFDGLTSTLELILDAARAAEHESGVGIGIMVAANRTKHPLDAKALARLAAKYADRGVVSFGLNNDERRGRALEFEGAFRIARRAGLLSAPHGGELQGPRSVRECLEELAADRVGHGVRATEDPYLLEHIATQGVTLELCPSSNVALGVFDEVERVPLRRLFEAGVPVALGTDDPLLFGPRLVEQYRIAREVFGFTDPELAELARMSIRGSGAPEALKKELLAGVDAWLAAPPDAG